MRGSIGRALVLAMSFTVAGSTMAAAAPPATPSQASAADASRSVPSTDAAPAARSSAVRWLHVYPGQDSAAADLAPAPGGGVYVLTTLQPGFRVTVRRIAADGTTVWTRRVATGAGAEGLGQGLASDATGYYVAWEDDTHNATPDGLTLSVRRYDLAGHAVWTAHWGTDLLFAGIAVSNGTVVAMYGEPQGTDRLAAPRVREIDASSGHLGPDWAVADESGAVAVDGDAIYTVTGVARAQGGADILLARWKLDGSPVWRRTITVGKRDLRVSGIALDPQGVTVGYWYFDAQNREVPFVQRDTRAGRKVWGHSLPSDGSPSGIAADATASTRPGTHGRGPSTGSRSTCAR